MPDRLRYSSMTPRVTGAVGGTPMKVSPTGPGGRGARGCCTGRLDLRQRQAGMVEEDPPRSGQRDTPRAADQQLCADLVLQVPDLPTEGRLCHVQPLRGRPRQTARLGDGDEIA